MSKETLKTINYIFGWNKNNDEYIKERKNYLNIAKTLIHGQLDNIINPQENPYGRKLIQYQGECNDLIEKIKESSKLIRTLKD